MGQNKQTLAYITSLILFFSFNVFGQVNNIEGKYGINTEMPTNYVRNKSCISNASYITGTGSTTQNTTPPVLSGKADCAIDDASSGLTHKWQTFTFDKKLDGGNCEAKFIYKGDASLYKAYVNVGGSKVTNDLQLTNATNPQNVSINFPCGLYSSAKEVVIESTSASAAAFNVVDVYAGAITNLGFADVDTAWADYTPTFTGFGTVSTSYMRWRRVGDTVEIQGAFNSGTPSATAASLTLPNSYTADVSIGGGQDQDIGTWTDNNGSATTAKKGHLLIADASNIIYFAFNDYTPAISGQTHQNGNAFAVNTQLIWINAKVKVDGLTANNIISSNLTSAFGYIKYAGISNCVWSSTSNQSYANFSADTDCNTATAVGNASAPGTKIPAIVIPNLPAGSWRFVALGGFKPTTVSNGCSWRFTDGTNATNQVVTETDAQGAVRWPQIEGVVTISTALSNSTWNLQATGSFGNTTCVIENSITNFTDFIIAVYPATQNVNAPILIGSVTSNSTVAEKLERARITNNGSTCSIASQSGSWLSSVARTATGRCTLTLASGFSSSPNCVVTQEPSSGVQQRTCSFAQPETNATIIVDCKTDATDTDHNFSILCMGPK